LFIETIADFLKNILINFVVWVVLHKIKRLQFVSDLKVLKEFQ